MVNDIETKITKRKDGYEVFRQNGKVIYLHRYLAEKHIPNPDNKCCVNHKDRNPTNNSLDNLKLLCPNCHSLTSTYKGANKNGRPRSKYY